MGRQSKGPRLYFDATDNVWVIRDLTLKKRTGFRLEQRQMAEAALARYLLGVPPPIANSAPGALIYFISTTEVPDFPIKIGITVDVVGRRLAQMQIGSPYFLTCLGTHPGGAEDERAIHQRFRLDHIRGEWFKRSATLINYIGKATLMPMPYGQEPVRNNAMFT